MAVLAASLLLTGCFGQQEAKPSVKEDGTVPVGSFLLISPAPEPLSLYDSKDALAADGLYYVSWVTGESEAYTNEDGDTVDLYPAQVTLLASELPDPEEARVTMEGWQSASTDHYEITETRTETIDGQAYEMITYTMKNSTGPWAGGVSAFTVHENAAVCVELTYRDSFDIDPGKILTELLGCFTYAA